MCRIIGLKTLWGKPKFIYEIGLADGSQAYMRVDGSAELGGKRSVVIVDARKFLALWRSCPNNIHADIAAGTPATWPNDRKFKDAAAGFADGVENPVPLAMVGYNEFNQVEDLYEPFMFLFKRKVGERSERVPYVFFSDGVTRTIWLMTNGAKSFPVEVESKEQAKYLYTHCGVGAPPAAVDDLTSGFAVSK